MKPCLRCRTRMVPADVTFCSWCTGTARLFGHTRPPEPIEQYAAELWGQINETECAA